MAEDNVVTNFLFSDPYGLDDGSNYDFDGFSDSDEDIVNSGYAEEADLSQNDGYSLEANSGYIDCYGVEENCKTDNSVTEEPISMLRKLEQSSKSSEDFSCFPDFFKFVQQKNMALSIERPSIKLCRSLRFSGHHATADKMNLFVTSYLADSTNFTSCKHTGTNTKGRDWNEEFQQLVELPDSRIKFLGLRNLAHDFVYAAETYGKIIISEHCLPEDMKTIKPIDIGGVAGGLKFICQGILFKFAIDYTGLYDGDENAMKTASHELKGLTSYFHCGMKDFHVPLMAYIDYRGFRLMALSLLPIGSNTLCYGSADGGRTVKDNNLHMNEIAKTIGKMLNLKKHKVGPYNTSIYGPADIEGHLGRDGRLYMLDFARVAPPQPPTKRGTQLYNLYRMEFVTKYHIPLSSDSFTAFGKVDGKENNEQNRIAMKYYMEHSIPSAATLLEQQSNEKKAQKQKQTPSAIIEFIHAQGINIRHLGYVRQQCESEDIKKILLVECVARTIKTQLNELMRLEMQACSVPSEKPFRQVVLDLFNLLLGNNEEFSQSYWNKQLKQTLQSKFPRILSEFEKQPDYRLSEHVSILNLFERLQEITSVTISSEALEELKNSPQDFELVDPDIVLRSRIVHLNLIDYADGMALYYEANNKTENPNTQLRLLSLARCRLESSLSQCGNSNYIAILQLGNISRALAMKQKENDKKREFYLKACTAFKSLTEGKCDEHLKFQAYFLWAKTLWSEAKNSQSNWNSGSPDSLPFILQLLDSSLELQPNNLNSKLLQAKIKFHVALKLCNSANFVAAKLKLAESLDYFDFTIFLTTSGNDDIALPVDCLLMKGRIKFLLFLCEMKLPDPSPTEIIPRAKELAKLLDSILEVSPEFKILKHISHSFLSDFSVLLTVHQFIVSHSSNMCNQIAKFMDECSGSQTFKLEDSLWKWISDPFSIVPVLSARSNLSKIIASTPSIDFPTQLLSTILTERGEGKQQSAVTFLAFMNVKISADALKQILSCSEGLLEIQFIGLELKTDENTEIVKFNYLSLPASLQSFRFYDPKFDMNIADMTLMSKGFPSNITTIDIRGVTAVQDNFLVSLQKQLPFLTTLVIIDCKNIIDEKNLIAFSGLHKLCIRGSGIELKPKVKIDEVTTHFSHLECLVDKNGLLSVYNTEEYPINIRIQKTMRAKSFLTFNCSAYPKDFLSITREHNLRKVYFNVGVSTGGNSYSDDTFYQTPTNTAFASANFSQFGNSVRCEFSCNLFEEKSNITMTKNSSMSMVQFEMNFMGQSVRVTGHTQASTAKFDCSVGGETASSLHVISSFSPPSFTVEPKFNIPFVVIPLLIPYLIFIEKF